LAELEVYGKAGAKVHTWRLDPGSIFTQEDCQWERPKSRPDVRGQLDISGTAVNLDVIPFDLRRIIVVENKKRTVVMHFAGSPAAGRERQARRERQAEIE
jgi:hypothetical protein